METILPYTSIEYFLQKAPADLIAQGKRQECQ